MLGLGQQVERERPGIDVAGGEDEQVARAGEAVDADLPEHLALGLLHVQVSGPDDHVDARDGLGPVGERGDRVGAAHPVDRVDAGEPAGREHDRIEVPVRAGRRAHGDLLDAGEPRGDRPHHHRARVRGPSARHVDRGALDRGLAVDDQVLAEPCWPGWSGDAARRHRLDVLDRALDPVADRRVERALPPRRARRLRRRSACGSRPPVSSVRE